MRAYNITSIANMLNAKHFQLNTDGVISELLLDSRQLIYPEKSLFFALKGERFDAHDYIDSLYQKGVRNFCVSKNINTENWEEANFW